MRTKDLIKNVKRIQIKARRSIDEIFIGLYCGAFKGSGTSFSEVRPYQFGDDIRRIDWNKTARFREPFVKIAEEEKELTILLAVDISASMDYGTSLQRKLEYIAEICATLGFSATMNNDKIGLLLFSDKVYKVIPPMKGKKHVLKIIASILDFEPVQKKVNFDYVLQCLARVFKKKSSVFIFSDFNDNFSLKYLRMVSSKHELLGIGVHDEKDIKIPDVGYAVFIDSETGKKKIVNTSDPHQRLHFSREKKNKLKQVEDFFVRSNSCFLKIDQKTNYYQLLSDYFKIKY